MSAEEEEARRIAEMGKPILGEHSRLEVVIEESYEFKVEPLSSLTYTHTHTHTHTCVCRLCFLGSDICQLMLPWQKTAVRSVCAGCCLVEDLVSPAESSPSLQE